MIKTTEKFNFSEPILNTTKLGLNRLSVYNNVNRGNNQFLCAGTVLDDDDALAEPVISISNTNFNPTSNIISFLIIIIKESHCYIQILHRVHMN